MRNIVLPLLTVAAFSLPTAPAQAQAPRTFVSAAGNDSNPCSFAAPCRHFQAAVNATTLGGEVDALDPAGYGPIIISQAVTIEGQGWSYIAPPANGNGITINATGSDNIKIHGVLINGVGIANATGIAFNSGGSLIIENSVVSDLTSSGIAFAPNSSANLAVSNTLAANNGGHGIYVQPTGNNVIVTAVFNRVEAYNNAQMGIGIFGNRITGNAFSVIGSAIDCSTLHNLDSGYYVLGGGGGETNIDVFRSTSHGDVTAGVRADSGGVAIVSQSDLFSFTPWSNSSGAGTVFSYGDNNSVAPVPGSTTIFSKK